MFFTIQYKVVLYKHFLVCRNTKHDRQAQWIKFTVRMIGRGNPQYLGFSKTVRSKICESARMFSQSFSSPWVSLPSVSRSRLANLSITSKMLANNGVTTH